MKKILTLIIGIGIGIGLFLNTVAIGFAAFSDVPDSHPFSVDIDYLEQTGIVTGRTFKPDKRVTRQEYAKWILKNAGFSGENYESTSRKRYRDVSVTNSYAPFIYKLRDIGIFENEIGSGLRFRPTRTIDRKTAIRWLFAVEGVPVPLVFSENDFRADDVSVFSVEAPLVHKAINMGILPAGKANLGRKLQRGEAAKYLRTVKNQSSTLTVSIVPATTSSLERNSKYDVLVGAWERILQNYLRRGDLNNDDLVYGAIEGMVKELDDKHSDFERPGDNGVLDSLSGQVEGIGAVLQMQDEDVVIVTPIKGGPAEEGGLIGGDIIIKVNDTSVEGMKLSEVAALIKGPKGTTVKITVRRGTRSRNFTITRDVVIIRSVILERTGDNIAQISLSNFGDSTNAEFREIANELRDNPPAGIVLDMRNNPGGYLTTAIQVAGYFINDNEVISTVRYADREENYYSSGSGELAAYNIVVLTNEGSASASEIVAGALKDYGLATIVGVKTYGKGTVQELSDFTDGSSLKITVAEWLTPEGNSIDHNGVVPDVEVRLTENDRNAGRDPQMDKALELLRTSPAPSV